MARPGPSAFPGERAFDPFREADEFFRHAPRWRPTFIEVVQFAGYREDDGLQLARVGRLREPLPCQAARPTAHLRTMFDEWIFR